MSYQGISPVILKKDTAVNLRCGPFLNSAFAELTGLAGTLNGTLQLSKNAGTLGGRNSTTAITHDAEAVYSVPLNATDTNTLGILQVIFGGGGGTYRPFCMEFVVVPAEVYDGLLGNTVPAEGSGPETKLLQRLNQLWARFFRKTVVETSALKVYKTGGSEWTKQAISDDPITQTQTTGTATIP
jgi:hypothetical protein